MELRHEGRRGKAYLLIIMAVIALRLFFWFSPGHADKISMTYLWPLAIAMLVYALCARTRRDGRDALIAVCLAAWLWLTCALNGDPYLQINGRFMLGAALTFAVCYPAFSLLAPDDGRRWFGVLAAFYTALVTAFALLCLYVAATRVPFTTPLSDLSIHTIYLRLYAFGYHSNECACAFAIALFMAVYLMGALKNIICKALCAVAVIILYAAVAITVSRTAMIIVSVALAAALYLLLYRALSKTRLWVRLAASVACAAVVFMAALSLFNPVINLIDGTLEKTEAPAPAAYTAPLVKASASGMTVAGAQSSSLQTREILSEIGTFTKRTYIWESALKYIKQNPRILLTGALDSDVSRVPMLYLDYEIYHMHNVYIEMLMLAGIPGLLAYLWLMLVILRACARLLLAPGLSFAMRFLAFVPPLLMLNGTMEIYPGLSGNIMDMMYMLISGAVVCFARDKRLALRARA